MTTGFENVKHSVICQEELAYQASCYTFGILDWMNIPRSIFFFFRLKFQGFDGS